MRQQNDKPNETSNIVTLSDNYRKSWNSGWWRIWTFKNDSKNSIMVRNGLILEIVQLPVNKSQTCNFIEKDSGTSVFLWILRNF